ncbi:MAG: hypothetical protein M1818_006237 [Claussenomyces sp. TS43310]|nr:MAG: hypothetical protein M1818_006237 [Claussenomyces sp. TS43310]
MGNGQPFMYDAVPRDSPRHPYSSFDPRAASRASLAPTPSRPKSEGPLLSFNQHPDSYLILPYGNTDAKPMNPSVKKHIVRTRVVQLILRCIELLGAIGALAVMILITNVNAATAWIMRIPPGLAMLHTMYSIYHLGRKPSRRTPGSSASYMLFSAALDTTLIPFYAFGALMAGEQYKLALHGTGQNGEWSSLLPSGQSQMPILSGTAFLCNTVSGGLHLISLGLSIWLAVTFRKITKLPPDMNPLEDHLTSRHKRNKSELTISTTSEKRTSMPMESRRNSQAPYEDPSRPPTMPFMHTRTASTDSFSKLQANESRSDLPNRQYQVPGSSQSPGTSTTNLRRASFHDSAVPSKRGSYTELPLSDPSARQLTPKKEAWFNSEDLLAGPASNTRSRANQSPTRSSPRKHAYAPLHQRHDSDDLIAHPFSSSHRNPLELNPPSPRRNPHPRTAQQQPSTHLFQSQTPQLSRKTPPAAAKGALTELSSSIANTRKSSSNYSGDLADAEREDEDALSTRWPRNDATAFKAKRYGDLRAGTPPVRGGERQVSSGNDFGSQRGAGGFSKLGRRDVSGKVAEEGRGGATATNENWGPRFRNGSGL